MSFTVLNDTEIRSLLESLALDELEGFRAELKSALHEYSTGTQSVQSGLIHQPERTSVHSNATGATTLFMPSASPVGHGVKVVTLSSAPNQTDDGTKPVIKPTGAITLFSPSGSPLGVLHASTLTAFRTALASLCLVHKRDTVKTLTVFGSGEQAYWHIRLTLLLRGSTIKQVNIINRRFSEAPKSLLRRIYSVPQVMKDREGWTDCVFGVLTPGYGEYDRLLREQVRQADVIVCCTPSTAPLFDASILTSHEGRRKGRLLVAVGSYTPSMRELPVEVIHQAIKHSSSHEGGHRHFHKHAQEGGVIIVDTLDGALKEAGELIDAGVDARQLVELGELVMLHRIKQSEQEQQEISSETVTDTVTDTASSELLLEKLDINLTGEGSSSSSMSSVFGFSSSSNRTQSPGRERRASSSSSSHGSSTTTTEQKKQTKKKAQKEDQLSRWLQNGNVIYKSVGLGLMDLSVGLHMIRFAKEKGVGSHIEGF
ncbi:putative ornithine cyclodeaminase [Diplogelasinospora grovesii]|uniref:Ornithine cyclodeaminase n=1 Tax=Diplogelasinospora grovesii TaxID=303347 RepID=A0AAN6NHH5_9PEZI|nr:putative ornithine cyclodeaminase [Diplogelasinospora grovesii]